MFNPVLRLVSRFAASRPASRLNRAALTVESLEGRELPSAYVWTGAVSSAWSNPANWSTPSGGSVSKAPGALDTATINNGSVNVTAQLKLVELDVNAGGAIHLVGTLRAPDTIGTVNLSGGTIYERGE